MRKRMTFGHREGHRGEEGSIDYGNAEVGQFAGRLDERDLSEFAFQTRGNRYAYFVQRCISAIEEVTGLDRIRVYLNSNVGFRAVQYSSVFPCKHRNARISQFLREVTR